VRHEGYVPERCRSGGEQGARAGVFECAGRVPVRGEAAEGYAAAAARELRRRRARPRPLVIATPSFLNNRKNLLEPKTEAEMLCEDRTRLLLAFHRR